MQAHGVHALKGAIPTPPQPLKGASSVPSLRWYHGSLSRSEAESLLTLCKECSYLVRTSQTNHSEYSLSLR